MYIYSRSFVLIAVAILFTVSPVIADFEFDVGEPDVENVYSNVGDVLFRLPIPELDLVFYTQRCSGTLIGDPPVVFLTAAHCFFGFEPLFQDPANKPTNIFVTFDKQVTTRVSPAELDPDLNFPRFQVEDILISPTWFSTESFADPGDIAALLLNVDPNSEVPPLGDLPEPAEVPTAGLLDRLAKKNGLKRQKFVTVGYGATDVLFANNIVDGPPVFFASTGFRHIAMSEFRSLAPSPGFITLSQNPSVGDSGACFGDSGGPNFLGDGRLIAAITITGDSMCRATNVVYRMDNKTAQNFFALIEQEWGVKILPE